MLRFMKKLISITLSFLISGIIFAENQKMIVGVKINLIFPKIF